MNLFEKALAEQSGDLIALCPNLDAANRIIRLCVQMQIEGMDTDDVVLSLTVAVSCIIDQRFGHLTRDGRIDLLITLLRGFRTETLQ